MGANRISDPTFEVQSSTFNAGDCEGFPPPSRRDADEADTGLREMLGVLARANGFTGAVYMHLGHGLGWPQEVGARIQPRRLAATHGFDESQYARRNYLACDPLAARARNSYSPFAWRLSELDDANPDRRRLLGVMAGWGMHQGVVTPVQDYALGPALLNLFDHGPQLGGGSAYGTLMLAAAQVHARAMTFRTSNEATQDLSLNPREMEVLRLAAIGCTEQETAMTLALSRRGVQFHLARAVEKLGSPNKTAAVARAVSAGLIRIS